jgi:hypothetical protein
VSERSVSLALDDIRPVLQFHGRHLDDGAYLRFLYELRDEIDDLIDVAQNPVAGKRGQRDERED